MQGPINERLQVYGQCLERIGEMSVKGYELPMITRPRSGDSMVIMVNTNVIYAFQAAKTVDRKCSRHGNEMIIT